MCQGSIWDRFCEKRLTGLNGIGQASPKWCLDATHSDDPTSILLAFATPRLRNEDDGSNRHGDFFSTTLRLGLLRPLDSEPLDGVRKQAAQLIYERFKLYHVGIFLLESDTDEREFAILKAAAGADGSAELTGQYQSAGSL